VTRRKERHAGETYLTISYLRGEPFAAYLYLPRDEGAKVACTDELRPGILVDLDADGKPMGIEIVFPMQTDPETVLAVAAEVHAGPISPQALEPLRASRAQARKVGPP
jgi:Protein of unknown function (DUF2283)